MNSRFLIVVAALTAVVAVCLATGYAPDALAGLGMLPLVAGQVSLQDIHKLVEEQGDGIKTFQDRQDARMKALEKDVGTITRRSALAEEQLLKDQRITLSGGEPRTVKDQSALPAWIDAKSGKPMPVLRHGDSLAELERKSGSQLLDGKAAPSVGRILRGICLGGNAPDAKELDEERKALGISSDPAGGYTVSGIGSAQWIDLLRARMVLSRAGAVMLPMEQGKVTIARVTADPTTAWKAENAAVSDSEPTFGAITLDAKTIVCLVKMSVELAQDAANIEQILQRVIVSAMAQAIDNAGMNGATVNAAGAPVGLFNLSGRNTVLAIGAPTSWDFLVDGMYELMLDNVPEERIGAFIGHPAIWKKMRKLKTGITNDNTPLTMPAEVAAVPKLWTTAAPLSGGTAKGLIADWGDLLFGVRKAITVRVLQEAYMGSNLQLAVLAYARVDFNATRAASFCTLEGITT